MKGYLKDPPVGRAAAAKLEHRRGPAHLVVNQAFLVGGRNHRRPVFVGPRHGAEPIAVRGGSLVALGL